MSLIDDALKRARDRNRGKDAPPDDATPPRAGQTPPGEKDPWAYAPLPERRSSRRAAGIAAAAAGILIAGAIVYFTARRDPGTPGSAVVRPSAFVSTPAPPGTPVRMASGSGPRTLATVEVPPPPRAPDFGARNPGLIATPVKGADIPLSATPFAPVSPPAVRAEPAPRETRLASASPRIATGSSSRTEIAGAPPHPAHPGPAATDGRSYVGSLTAPNGAKIELEGIVYSESSPVALVNGRVLPPGGFVEGLDVVSIEPNRIELKGDGIRVFLTLK